MATEPELAGPTPEELAALVREHRPATSRVPTEYGAATLPIDWRTLPMTALLWSARGGDDPLLVDGALVTTEPGREALVARDLRSGQERWRVETPHAIGERPYAVAGCQRVVLFDSERIAGLDPATGAALWEIPLEPTNSVMTRPGAASMQGCHLAFLVADDAMRLADGFSTSRLRLVDVRTGRITARPTCAAPCALVSTEREGVVVNTSEDQRWLFPWEGGEPARLPAGTDHLTPDLAIAIDQGTLVARERTSAEVRWRRELDSGAMVRGPLLTRTEDDLIATDGSALVRVSAATGQDVWRTPLSSELANAIRRFDGHAHDPTRLIVGSRGVPQLLLDVDLGTGVPRSLRVSAIDPVDLALEGDLLAVRSHERSGVVDLSLEAPALRERLTLEDDLARTIAALTAGERASGAPWSYPTGRAQSIEWLRRLGPLLGDAVTLRIERAELDTAAALLPALEGAPNAMPMAVSVLERTYGCSPTPRHARARAAASAALEPPLDAAHANELASETIAWLDELHRRAARGSSGRADRAAWEAVMSGRDALLRTSVSSAPLRRFEEAIRRHAPTTIASRCVPSDDDAARAAVLRYGYELAASPIRTTVRVPGAHCVEVQTLGGPLEVVTDGDSPAPWILVGPALRVEEVRDYPVELTTLPWPDAPARAIALTYYAGSITGQADLLIVQRVDGEWRVVWTATLWVS